MKMSKWRLRAATIPLLLSVLLTGCPRNQDEVDPDFAAKSGETDVFGEEGVTSGGSLDRWRRGEDGADGTGPGSEGGGPLTDVYFGFDSFEITDATREALRQNAEWLRENGSVRVEIEGHTDDRGTVEYNLALGAKRSRAAKEYLVALGISPSRLSTISYGEELPVCYDANESCWSRNRRVHFVTRGE